ncbi:MAG: glycosyltransferase family 39 protein [Phycisphaeraceae bacterium]|nr:glycosyltransferase family 39 protein [Phycisphaeraceae bacterium]
MPKWSRDQTWLLGLFAAALLLRLWAVAEFQASPLGHLLFLDGESYDQWARQLADGDWIGAGVFYQAPGYPYFLGVIYTMCGHGFVAVRLAQALLGAAGAVLLTLAGRRWIDEKAGWIAGVMLAVWPIAIHFDLLIQKTSLTMFLTTLVLWLLGGVREHGSARRALTAGMALGALALVQEQTMALAIVALLWLMWKAWKVRCRQVAPPAAMALGLALVLLPVAVRNEIVGGEFHLTTSQLGPNFYIGNHPGATGFYVGLRPERGHPRYERQDATELAQEDVGRRLQPAEVSRYWLIRTFRENSADPVGWLKLLGRKAMLLVQAVEIGDGEDVYSAGDFVTYLRWATPVLHYGVLVPVAAVGVAMMLRKRKTWPLLALTATYATTLVAFYVMARYRVPLTAMLMLAAGVVVAAASNWRSPATWKALAPAAAIAVACNWPMVDPQQIRAVSYANIGTELMFAHESPVLAEQWFLKALAINPEHFKAMNNLGIVLARQGRYDEAIAWYGKALALQPDFAEAKFNLEAAKRARKE